MFCSCLRIDFLQRGPKEQTPVSNPACRAGGLGCAFLCQQLSHSLAQTLPSYAQTSWFFLSVLLMAAPDSPPLTPHYARGRSGFAEISCDAYRWRTHVIS